MLLNLVSNALKFTFKGFIKVTIRIIHNTVHFEVRDTGVGIKEESIPTLFKLFGKLQENENINRTGCGIGLHVSQELVTRLGGVILVDSKENEGSVFSFELPMIEDGESQPTSEVNIATLDNYISSNVILASRRRMGEQPRGALAEEEEKISFCEKLIIAVDD